MKKSSIKNHKRIFKIFLGVSITLFPILISSCTIKKIDQPIKTKTNDKDNLTTINSPSKNNDKNPKPSITKNPIIPTNKPKKPNQDPKPLNPKVPNFDPSNPALIPNIPNRHILLSASNLNPIDNFFEKSSFQKPDQKTIYKEIYNRSFGVKFTRKDVWDEQNNVPNPNAGYLSSTGTGWLLDYAASDDKTKFSLFFATNLHVLKTIGNTFEDENGKKHNKTNIFDYSDPTGNYAVGISFGKPSIDPINFEPLPNNSEFSVTTKGNPVQYYTNLSGIKDVDTGTKVSSIISAPKLIFAGFDFMKNNEYSQFDPFIKKVTKEYLDKGKTDEYVRKTSKYYWTNEFYKQDKLPQLYKDFAIFQVDIDFTKNTTAQDETFKNYILKAIDALDESIKRVKQNIVPNHDGSNNPYIKYDYASIQKNPDLINKKELKNYKYAQQYVDDFLVAGYPGSSSIQYWARNNPTERYTESKNKVLGNRNISAQLTSSNSDIKSFLNRPLAEYYGFKYSNLQYSALPPGTSGSVGYNDYGLVVGIYSDYSLSNKSGFDIKKDGFLTSLNQSSDIKIRMFDGSEATIHAYDMIDGSNKKLYPEQKNSYRENINILYPNGIGPFKFNKTAIFPEGFKIN